jgi:hypothetical protein
MGEDRRISENGGRILGNAGEKLPCIKSCGELFAMERSA